MEASTTRANGSDTAEAIREAIEAELDHPESSPQRKVALRALRRVNQIRELFGHAPLSDLRRGVVGDSGDCPLARSLRLDEAIIYVDGARIRCEEATQAELIVDTLNENLYRGEGYGEAGYVMGFDEFEDFVTDFDAGVLPQYAISD